MSTLAEVEALLDPVLVGYGFAVGQDGGRGAGLGLGLGLGSIVEVDLEGAALPERLRIIGRTADAAEAAAVFCTPAKDATPILAAVLTRLFEDPHGKNNDRAQPSP